MKRNANKIHILRLISNLFGTRNHDKCIKINISEKVEFLVFKFSDCNRSTR